MCGGEADSEGDVDLSVLVSWFPCFIFRDLSSYIFFVSYLSLESSSLTNYQFSSSRLCILNLSS